jgi:hypothetical protein
MTLVLKFRAHPCRKSLLEVVNKEIFHLVGVLVPGVLGEGAVEKPGSQDSWHSTG